MVYAKTKETVEAIQYTGSNVMDVVNWVSDVATPCSITGSWYISGPYPTCHPVIERSVLIIAVGKYEFTVEAGQFIAKSQFGVLATIGEVEFKSKYMSM